MWLKISEDIYLPADKLVGFFAPETLCGADESGAREEAGKDRAVRGIALMRDGRALPMPFTPKALAARFERAARDSF